MSINSSREDALHMCHYLSIYLGFSLASTDIDVSKCVLLTSNRYLHLTETPLCNTSTKSMPNLNWPLSSVACFKPRCVWLCYKREH